MVRILSVVLVLFVLLQSGGNLGFLELLFLISIPVVVWILTGIRRRSPTATSSSGAVAPGTDTPRQSSDSPDRRSPTIFLSYRRQDSADVTGRIYDKLVNRLGRPRVFKDVDSVPLGVDFRKHLDQIVGTCDIVLAIIGDEWVETRDPQGRRRIDDPVDLVRIEIESALRRGIQVIPVLVKGSSMPREAELPDSLKELAYRNGLSVRPDPDFHTDMERLLAGLGVPAKT